MCGVQITRGSVSSGSAGSGQRLLVKDVQRGPARTSGDQRVDQGAGGDETRPAGVDQQGVGLHQGEVGGGDDAAGLGNQA